MFDKLIDFEEYNNRINLKYQILAKKLAKKDIYKIIFDL